MIYDKKKICPDIMSDHIWDFVGHEQMSDDRQLFAALVRIEQLANWA